MMRLTTCLLLFAGLVWAAPAQDDRFLLVTDNAAGRVLAVNPFSGVRTEITGPDRGAGPAVGQIEGVAFHSEDREIFLVISRDFQGAPALVQVEWGTGVRTLVSSQDRGSGPDFSRPRQVVVLNGGDFAVVADEDRDRLILVRLVDGDRDFFDLAGAFLRQPTSVGADRFDCVWVNYQGDFSISLEGRLQRVTFAGLVTDQVIFPLFGDFATEHGPSGIFPEVTDDILTCSPEVPAVIRYLVDAFGEVFGVQVVSAGSNFDILPRGDGPNFDRPLDIVRADTGEIFVLDENLIAVVEVAPLSGDRSILSSGAVAPGPAFEGPRAMALGRGVPDVTPTDVARHVTGEASLSLAEQEDADINDDGILDATDVVFLANLGL
jgi:hypothetical protein